MGSKMKEDLTVEKARMLARMHEASSSSPSRQREEKVRGGNGRVNAQRNEFCDLTPTLTLRVSGPQFPPLE